MRVFVENHGCRLNQADGEGLEVLLARAGHALVAEATSADLVVLNTCSITHRAGADARQRARAHTRAGARVVVTGCHANAAPEEFAALPGVEAVLGNEQKEALVSALMGPARHDGQLVSAERLLRRRVSIDLPVQPRPARARAHLKVQDGCNYRCAFCIVPSLRGRSRSLPLYEVAARARALAAVDTPEIVITGVHLGTYGWDLGLRPGLATLLRTVLDAAPEARVRLGSVDPHEVDPALIELMAAEPRVCPHLHLPIQSGDDGVLARMRRAHRRADLERLVPELRRRVEGIALGSDIIVGHPGEDDAAFARTLALAREQLDYAHVFPFSPRPGTEAATMEGAVAPEPRRHRAATLRATMAQRWATFRRALVGRELAAVVHRGGDVGRDHRRGITAEGVRVSIRGVGAAPGTGDGADPLGGRRLRVRVTAVEGDSTWATPL